mgnify:CR=1 FL=1
MHVLLVEDDDLVASGLEAGLTLHHCTVDRVRTTREARAAISQFGCDVVILDLGLPDGDGMGLLDHWRQQGVATPVLILTARSRWTERVEGLQAGADDYLTKPFHNEELLLRVQALLRRAHGRVPQALLSVAGLQLDEAQQQVRVGDAEPLSLSASEFKLLRYFMLNPGKVLSKTQLAEHLYDYEDERDSNVIEVLINHLRRKLGREAIETRRGQGYVLVGQCMAV